jgi:hypothetical protein
VSDIERERKKKRGNNEKIKIEIRTSQVQTTITFDRKFRLRCSTWPQKPKDEIYRVNTIVVTVIFGAKKSHLDPKKCI